MKLKLLSSLLLLSMMLVNTDTSTPYIEKQTPIKEIKKQNSDFADQELNVYICADYINDELVEAFQEEYDCIVNIYTYDTNETMYNQFTLQPEGTYDLICTSDYMIQRMIRENLVQKINISEDLPIYNKYCAPSIREKIKGLLADTDNDGVKDTSLDEYSAGYMWGTLGIVYDPYCSDTIQEDVKSWDIFWDETYKDLISIKNSMRDTFVVGLMHAYKGSEISGLEDVLTPARNTFLSELESAKSEEEKEVARNKYNKVVQDIFDLVITEEDYEPILNIVKKELISLKDNIFGFEVDSGKNDIITGKIKMNLAWSGDAVYSIDQALESDKVLEYYVPEDGSNVWYDAWSIPNKANKELACAFMEYLSTPNNAAANMDYIGYTSFIACDEVFDLITSWYGVSEYSDSTYYYQANEEEEIDASLVIYNDKYYSCIKDAQGILPTNEEYFEEISFEDAGILEEPYDLSYFFKENGDSNRNYIVYPYDGSLNQLQTQYPDVDTIARCAVMNEFAYANDAVVVMWGQVKAYTQMLPYYIVVGSTVTIAIIYFVSKAIIKNKSTRNKRRLESIK